MTLPESGEGGGCSPPSRPPGSYVYGDTTSTPSHSLSLQARFDKCFTLIYTAI